MNVDDGTGKLRDGLAGVSAELETSGLQQKPTRDYDDNEESDGSVESDVQSDVDSGRRRRLADGTGVMRAISVDAKPRATSAKARTKMSEARVVEVKAGARIDGAAARAAGGTLSILDALSSLVLRSDVGNAQAVRSEPARVDTMHGVLARGSSRDLGAELALANEIAMTLDADEQIELRADAEALDLDIDIADGVELAPDVDDAGDEDANDVLDASDDEIDPPVPATSKRVRRRTKRDRPRSKTIAMKRVTRAELHAGALMYPPVEDIERPRTRAECKEEARPCPWVSCKHHLYLDINPETGSIKINFPDLEPWEMQHTCSLDVAEAGALTLEEIGLITNLTRERIRQVEVRGLLKLQARREIR